MNIFISYASEDKDLAEKIHFALLGARHETFFDKDSLPAGDSYRLRISAAIDQADAMVFLISPESIEKGCFALTELKKARKRWPHARSRVLPVMVRDVEWSELPNYLAAVSVLEPEGDAPAEVVMAISEFQVDQVEYDDGEPIDEDYEAYDYDSSAFPSVYFEQIHHLHNVPVATPGGPVPGMQVIASVRVANADNRELHLVSKFMHAHGQPLYANPQEPHYRDGAGMIATGTPPIHVTSSDAHYQGQVMMIPYYALNFPQTGGMMTHNLQFITMAYAGTEFIGQSHPQPFYLCW
ncbi:MAG: toll/interleukin-1 receptor domain-containing protein [Woeseiaceae bacterium]|nr:toll/interleukin-1 receptor domain-containing protein [Woeseiaceae bacterium]